MKPEKRTGDKRIPQGEPTVTGCCPNFGESCQQVENTQMKQIKHAY